MTGASSAVDPARLEERNTALADEITRLKRERNAIILSHNYQRPEIQDLADFVGDSLELARKAAQVESADVIVFCGVHFMAETAKILNPRRVVLLPERTAGCPMADTIDAYALREWKQRYPEAAVVCYVNSTAAVKAESDACCTSANALKVVDSLPHSEILFVPDKNLGHFVSRHTKKRMILYPGACSTHVKLNASHVLEARKLYPNAPVVVHPECEPEVVDLADAVLSTSQMLRYVKESPADTFLIGTEAGLLHRMHLENPGKSFYVLSRALLCPNMKQTHLKSVLRALQETRYEITLDEEIRLQAKRALDRMLELV
ncbi:MAG: quinolinate synthase NadA [Chloroflexi bacterium]|nr:quinolinate synthase NadA [Chloroflexota bacterium]